MSYLPEMHRCAWCNVDLGPDNGDGTCASCDEKVVECEECGNDKMPDKPCGVCLQQLSDLDGIDYVEAVNPPFPPITKLSAKGLDVSSFYECNCGSPLDGSHDHTSCGPPNPITRPPESDGLPD